jgi:hypothetical protein
MSIIITLFNSNIKFMFKKLIIVSLLALCLITPNLAKAQTVTQEEVNAQLLQVINALMVQVQELMTKLVAMQAQQETDSQTLQTVVTQTTPVINYGAVQQTETPKVETFHDYFEKKLASCSPKAVNPHSQVFLDRIANKEFSEDDLVAYWESEHFIFSHIEDMQRRGIYNQVPVYEFAGDKGNKGRAMYIQDEIGRASCRERV